MSNVSSGATAKAQYSLDEEEANTAHAAALSQCPVSHEPQQSFSPTGCPVSDNAAAFDPFGGAYQIDPAEALRWSRDQEPVFYSPKLGYWVVTRYNDVKAIFRDNILFSPSIALEKITPAPKEAEEILKRYGYAMDRTMVNEDEPAHMLRRRLLLDAFAPEAIAKHEHAVRDLTRQYMDRFIDKGKADLVAEMFWEIPLIVALHFLGVENDDIDQLRQFCVAHTINTWGRPTKEEQLHVADSVGRFWQAANHILDKMMENPDGNGWMYYSIRQHFAHPDIVPLSYLRSMMMAILAAAHETTSNATANAFQMLLSNRAVWEEIRENRDLIPNAVEECLRRSGSIIAWRRLATQKTKIGDVDIPKGAKLLVVMASANHDERHFENPDILDMYRDNSAEHLSFGYGSHQCMGRNIARMEMRIFLEEFLKRLPHLELVPDQTYKYLPNTSFRGPDALWVKWDPAKNPERRDRSILGQERGFKIGPPSRNEIVRRLRVADITIEGEGLKRFVFESPNGRVLPRWTPGSHIDLRIGDYERKYSLCGDPADESRWEVAILRDEDGRGGSKLIHDTLKINDVIKVRGPKNHFRLDESGTRYLLIAGGIGITPIMAMADRLKTLGRDYEIHYAGRSLETMAFGERLKASHGSRLHLHVKAEGRRMDLRTLTSGSAGAQIYACGPERMLGALEELSHSWPENRLHVEHFAPDLSLFDPANSHAFEVELADSKLTIAVKPDHSLLETLESIGIDVPSDCREGLCGSCEVQVIEGEIDHRDKVLSAKERSSNTRMMACCSRAKGSKIAIAL
jgi:cytochrome P450/ferredoxin-NADP reductase